MSRPYQVWGRDEQSMGAESARRGSLLVAAAEWLAEHLRETRGEWMAQGLLELFESSKGLAASPLTLMWPRGTEVEL